jgi:hypothetical protein
MIGMTQKTLGSGWAAGAGATYLFLHYALLVAYVAQVCVSPCEPLEAGTMAEVGLLW